MNMGIFEGSISAIITGIISIVGYLHKSNVTKIAKLEEKLDEQQNIVHTKVNRAETKEIVDDKLAPLHVTLKGLQEDITEIKTDVKKIISKD